MTAQAPLAIMEEVAPINWLTILVNVQMGGQEKLVMIALQQNLQQQQLQHQLNLQQPTIKAISNPKAIN